MSTCAASTQEACEGCSSSNEHGANPARDTGATARRIDAHHIGLGEGVKRGGAESGALRTEHSPVDARLKRIVDAWPELPEPIRAGIVAMIDAARAI